MVLIVVLKAIEVMQWRAEWDGSAVSSSGAIRGLVFGISSRRDKNGRG